jgi:hypothetical protein
LEFHREITYLTIENIQSMTRMMRLTHCRGVETCFCKVFESSNDRRDIRNNPYGVLDYIAGYMVDEAKDATLKAAKRAGIGNRLQDEVFTIREA